MTKKSEKNVKVEGQKKDRKDTEEVTNKRQKDSEVREKERQSQELGDRDEED